MTKEEKQQIEDEIEAVEDFTEEYWFPLLNEWNSDPANMIKSPNRGWVLLSIIANRQSYTLKLRKYLKDIHS